MRNHYLQDLIKKIQKKSGKIIYSDDLKKIIATLMGDAYEPKKAYKLIYYLKNRQHLLSLKKNIFYVCSPDEDVIEEDIIEDFYRDILSQHCQGDVKRKRYIGGMKALELHYANYTVPDTILIINTKKQSQEMVLATKALHYKTYTAKGNNLYTFFRKYTETIKIGKKTFRIAGKELALLECTFNFDTMFDKYTAELVKKVLKRSKQLDSSIFADIIKTGKHHTSINRLYQLAKSTNKPLAQELYEIIKRYSFVLDV